MYNSLLFTSFFYILSIHGLSAVYNRSQTVHILLLPKISATLFLCWLWSSIQSNIISPKIVKWSFISLTMRQPCPCAPGGHHSKLQRKLRITYPLHLPDPDPTLQHQNLFISSHWLRLHSPCWTCSTRTCKQALPSERMHVRQCTASVEAHIAHAQLCACIHAHTH